MQNDKYIEGFRAWVEENKGSIEKPGSVEQIVFGLVQKIVRCYANELDDNRLQITELSHLDLMAIAAPVCCYGCFYEKIISRIDNSHLSSESKEAIKDEISQAKTVVADQELGFFRSKWSYGVKVPDADAQRVIVALCDAINAKSFEQRLEILRSVPDKELTQLNCATLSMLFHPIQPTAFPICNNVGDEAWRRVIPGYKKSASYWEKTKLINDFTASQPDWWPKNYRYFDEYIFFNDPSNGASGEPDGNKQVVQQMEKPIVAKTDIKLNTILYGPPGTGKTYNTTAYAVAICEDRTFSDLQEEMATDEEAVNQRFKALKEEGRIAFVTFHQSYGYEDFVEGIRPVLPCDEGLSDDGDIQYDVIDGIFKEMSDRAREYSGTKSEDESPSDGNGLGEDEVEGVIEQYASFVQESNDEGQEVPLKGDVTITAINHYRDGRPKSFVLGGSNTSHQWVSFKWARRDFADYCDGTIKSYRDVKASKGGNTHGNAGYLFALYKKMREFMESDAYEQQPKQEPKQEKARKNFVLIIDEINRGNISKVFGELITLLEDDKREGGKHPIGVMLPHSPEEFYVPSNLYVLGTMNTADRSIALMDTALRRRFDFVEMMPKQELASKYKIGSDQGIDCSVTVADLMGKMNERIEALYDREHTIGHSYFMNIGSFDQLKEKFEREIIPLLQEYFYDDYGKIRLVLADSIDGVDEGHQFVKERDIDSALFEGMDSDLVPEKKIYGINADAFDDPLSYIKICSMSEYRTAKE